MGERHTPATLARRIWRDRPNVERALRLDASALVRAVRRQYPEQWRRWSDTDEAVVGPVAVPLTCDGAPAGEMAMAVALDGTRGTASFPGGASVALAARPMNLPDGQAGFRWAWRCPRLGHRCDALFLPPGGAGFLSRQAHGLRHRCVRERPVERMARKARKLRAKLGEAPAVLGDPLPHRPPWMREPVYLRLVAALQKAEDQALAGSLALAARHLVPGP